MQTDQHWQEHTISRFMQASRQYLGLVRATAGITPHRRIAGSGRKLLRSLVIASSLGALFGSSAFATEASRQTEPAKRSPNAHGVRSKVDGDATQSSRFFSHGRHR